MARLVTCGFEVARVSTTAITTSDGEAVFYSGTPTFTTTNARTGTCMSVTGTSNQVMRADIAGVLDRVYYIRFYHRRTANPSGADAQIWAANDGVNGAIQLQVDGSANLLLVGGAAEATVATGTGAFPSDSAYHKVECKFTIPTAGNGASTVWVDNVQVIDGTFDFDNTIFNRMVFGQNTSSSSGSGGLFDDIAVNDDQGADQNGRCGDGRIWHLVPTVLGAGGRGNWVDGGGGTTNLHDSLNNAPPTGTATGSNGTQIENATSGTSSAEFDTQTYDSVVPIGDAITLVAGLWKIGTDSLTGTNTGTARLFGNPDVGGDTTVDFEGSTAVAGTDPAGWRTYKSAYVYKPVVARPNVAQLRITKTQATTRVHSCDYMAVQVESTPASLVFPRQGLPANLYLR